jgi:hypothetical protein
VPAAPSGDRRVVGNCFDGLVRTPDGARATVGLGRGLHPTAEVDIILNLRTRKFPRITEGQPIFRIFVLPAVSDDLSEQSMIVADAIAAGWYTQRCQTLHEAGGEPAQAAVAECGVRLGSSQPVEIDSGIAQCRMKNFC